MDENQCRSCLDELTSNGINLSKKVNGILVKKKLEIVCGIEISESDTLSKSICKTCLELCNSFYTFKNKFIENDRTLKNLERKMKLKISELINISDTQFVDSTVKKTSEPIEDDYVIFEDFEALEDECDEIIEQIDVEENYEPELYEEVDNSMKDEELIEEIFVDKQEEPQYETDSTFCKTCNFLFYDHDPQIIQKHMKNHEKGKNICCMICPELFLTQKTMESHRSRYHTDVVSVSCKKCKVEFDSNEAFEEHKLNCAKSKKNFICYICKETFTKGIWKKKHIQEVHKDKAGLDCPLCFRCKIPSAVAYENHYKIHFIDPEYICNFCEKTFYESDRLQTHIKRFHTIVDYICDACGKKFRDKSGISRHISGVHLDKRDHQCPHCTKAFTASYNLKEHLFSVHKEKSNVYSCNMCDRDFLYRKQFERHRDQCQSSKVKNYRLTARMTKIHE